jgi:raffinose/stachyose/melibiose transport system substrate-binding protein
MEVFMNTKLRGAFTAAILILGVTGAVYSGGGQQGSGGGARTTIDFYTWRVQAGIYPDSTIKLFEQNNPDIKVNYDGGIAAVDMYLNNQKDKLLSGDGIDVTSIRPETLSDYVKAGYLDKIDENEPFLKNFGPAMLDAVRVNGSLYSIPESVNIIGVYYNKNIFRRLGLSEPKNWNEYIAVLDKIKADGITPMMNGAKDGWPIEFDVFPIIHDVLAKDPQIFDKIEKGQAKYTDPVWVNAFRRIEDFYKKGYIRSEALSMGSDQATTLFLQEKTAIMIQGEWHMTGLSGEDAEGNKIEAPFEIGVFTLPHNMPGEPQVASVSVGASEGIVAKSKHKEAAKKFLAHLTTPEAVKLFAVGQSSFSAATGAPADFHPLAKLWIPIKDMDRNVNFFYSIQHPAVNSEMLKQLQLMFLGQASPEQALREMQRVQDNLN